CEPTSAIQPPATITITARAVGVRTLRNVSRGVITTASWRDSREFSERVRNRVRAIASRPQSRKIVRVRTCGARRSFLALGSHSHSQGGRVMAAEPEDHPDVQVFDEIRYIEHLARTAIASKLPVGLTYPQFEVMNHLSRRGDGVTPLS